MKDGQVVITILGSAGGVARSILSLLNQTAIEAKAPLNRLIAGSTIHLIDIKQKTKDYYDILFPHLDSKIVLHQMDLSKTEHLTHHLKNTGTTTVIDVSWADTVEMLKCCNDLGVQYVNAAIESTFVDEHENQFQGFALLEKIKLLEQYKNSCSNTSAIIGSGMNPGLVQWMAIELINQTPEEMPCGCYIVEHDTTFFKNKKQAAQNTLYTTWSPECFLNEAISSFPMFMQNHTPLFLYEDVYNLQFNVTLGDKQFSGRLMTHEEVYSLGKLFPFEIGFIYEINEHTSHLIESHLDNVDVLWDYEAHVLDPLKDELEGQDSVGVLLVYSDRECYLYNELRTKDIFNKYQINATYFQVACGLYASLCVLLLDSIPKGTYYVDEMLLNTNNHFGQYVRYHLTDFVTGTNPQSEGLLLQRMTYVSKK